MLQSALVALQLLKNSCLDSEECDRVYKTLKAAISAGKIDDACEKRNEPGGRKVVGHFCYNCCYDFSDNILFSSGRIILLHSCPSSIAKESCLLLQLV